MIGNLDWKTSWLSEGIKIKSISAIDAQGRFDYCLSPRCAPRCLSNYLQAPNPQFSHFRPVSIQSTVLTHSPMANEVTIAFVIIKALGEFLSLIYKLTVANQS